MPEEIFYSEKTIPPPPTPLKIKSMVPKREFQEGIGTLLGKIIDIFKNVGIKHFKL